MSVTAGDQGFPEGTRSQVLRSTSVDSQRLRASKLSVLKLTEIMIFWIYYTILFGFSVISHFFRITYQLLNYYVLLRITDEGSVPEMRTWYILLIKSDLKWCMNLSSSLFSYWFVRCEANFVSSGFKIVKLLRRRKFDPWIIERIIGLMLGPSTALYRSFIKHCTLTNKAVGTI